MKGQELLDKIADAVLAYRPARKRKKARTSKTRPSGKKTKGA